MSPINRDALYRSLRPLTQLIFILFAVDNELNDFAFDLLDVFADDDAHQIRLPSIKLIVYIILGQIESHRMFASFRMGHIFPNVQVAELKFKVNTLCQECQRNNKIDPSEYDSACLQPMLRPFKQDLPKLKRILTGGTEYFV